MRKSLCIILVAGVLVCSGASIKKSKLPAQGTETKLEAFENQTGTVIIRGRSDIGKVSARGSVSVVCIEIIDVSTGQRQMGIVFEVTEGGRYESSDNSFVDYDEIESLLNGIDYVSKVTPKSTKLSRFEATYKTKGDFSVVTFNKISANFEAAVSSGYAGSTSAYMTKAKLSELRSIIAKAKEKLDEIK